MFSRTESASETCALKARFPVQFLVFTECSAELIVQIFVRLNVLTTRTVQVIIGASREHRQNSHSGVRPRKYLIKYLSSHVRR